MKYLLCAAVVFCVTGLLSCREKPASRPTVLDRQLTLPSGAPATTPANPVLPGSNPIVTSNKSSAVNPAHGQPGHRCDIAVGAPLPASAQVSSAAAPTTSNAITSAIQPVSLPGSNAAAPNPAVALNPAHGKPGHRCDISVGAPLNSKPTAKTTTATPTSTLTPKPTVLQPDTLFAKGLNPAHGQPGHRCDVAVGKPLNEVKKTGSPVSQAAIPLKPIGN